MVRDILILFTISVTFLYKFSFLILKWKIHTHFSPNCPYVLHNLFCVWTKMLSKSLSKCLCRFFFLLFQYVIYATTFSDGISYPKPEVWILEVPLRNGFMASLFLFCLICGIIDAKSSNTCQKIGKKWRQACSICLKCIFWLILGTQKSDFGYPIRHYLLLHCVQTSIKLSGISSDPKKNTISSLDSIVAIVLYY